MEVRRWVVTKHIVPALGQIRVDRLTPDQVEDWLGSVAARGASKSTVNRLRVTLRQVLAEAVRRRQLTWNVADVVHVPKAPDNVQDRQALDPEQAGALLHAAEEHRLGAWLTVTMLLGLRPGETSALTWADVDLDERTLRVGSQLRWAAQRPELVAPKTARSTRTLRLDDRTVRALHQHRKRQAEERIRVGRYWPDEWRDLVFVSEAGTPLEPRNLRRAMASISRTAGLPRAVRPYELRHTAATIASHAGVRIEDLADQFGHSGTRMLSKHYRHSPRIIEATAGVVAGALRSDAADLAAEGR